MGARGDHQCLGDGLLAHHHGRDAGSGGREAVGRERLPDGDVQRRGLPELHGRGRLRYLEAECAWCGCFLVAYTEKN